MRSCGVTEGKGGGRLQCYDVIGSNGDGRVRSHYVICGKGDGRYCDVMQSEWW